MNKSDAINQSYLLNEQYKDASNFNTRLSMIQRLSNSPIEWYPWIFNLLKKAPDNRVLELGCGPGYLWQKNLESIPPGWNITLSDFSPGMLKEAKNNLSHHNRHFTFQVADAQAIPFQEDSFDLLIADLMLYHVPNRPRAFAEIRRVLRADGSFYAATFSETIFATLEKLLKNAAMDTWLDELGFSVENGAQQLSQWFSDVKLHALENTLRITETEPLLTVIRTGTPQGRYNEANFQHLRELIQQEIDQQGAIYMNMGIGLFEASGLLTKH